MKIVVGLGNPGRKYNQTRHNIGFAVVAEAARRWSDGRPRTKFQCEMIEAVVGTQRLLLVSPITYMNLSGQGVQPLMQFYKTPLEDLLVVCDDLNLPLGKLRIRKQGSAGGQKGLQDIIRRLGSQDIARLRIGIGSPPANWAGADYVLSRFTSEEKEIVDIAVRDAVDALQIWAEEGIDTAMNRFN